ITGLWAGRITRMLSGTRVATPACSTSSRPCAVTVTWAGDVAVMGACMGCAKRTFFFFSSRRRHTRSTRDWSSDVCSSDLGDRLLTRHRALPDGTADEERAEALEVQRRLLRLPHRLDDRRERIEILPDQSDDEVVRSEERRVGKESKHGGVWRIGKSYTRQR